MVASTTSRESNARTTRHVVLAVERASASPQRSTAGTLGRLIAVISAAFAASWGTSSDLPLAVVKMPLPVAWKVLGVKSTATSGEIKKAFRRKIREVHPDVIGDDGTQLQRVRDAFEVAESVKNPTKWDFEGMEAGLPAWAAGLLSGVQWSPECPSYAAFLEKGDSKALAVGELDEKTGTRPWAASWGRYSQQDANAEALRVCRQNGARCRLVYVGSGAARAKPAPTPSAGQDEREWWREQFAGAGDIPGFGWMPMINPAKEHLVGHKSIPGGERFGAEVRVRVPVFRQRNANGAVTGLPYYYSPIRPKERIYMKKQNFKHVRRGERVKKSDPRIRQAKFMTQQQTWS